jgi:hypothetical protein
VDPPDLEGRKEVDIEEITLPANFSYLAEIEQENESEEGRNFPKPPKVG